LVKDRRSAVLSSLNGQIFPPENARFALCSGNRKAAQAGGRRVVDASIKGVKKVRAAEGKLRRSDLLRIVSSTAPARPAMSLL
jgi:hypothetical protein